MIKHAKPKNFVYYLKRLTVLAVALCFIMQIPVVIKHFDSIDIEGILDKSELKNVHFKAKVQKIEQGALTAYFMEEHSNPIVSISFIFQNAGAAHDDENKQGMALLAAALLTEGAGDYDSRTFKEAAEENGVKIGFSVSADDFSGSLSFPKANMPAAVNLFKAALYEPHLEEDDINIKKQQLLTALQMQKENPKQLLANKFKEDIFAGHPYARNSIGKAADIQSVTAEEMREFLRNNLAQDNIIVGIAGDLSKNEAQNVLADLFAGLPMKSQAKPLAKIDFSADGVEYSVERKSAQAMTRLAARGTYRDSVDFYPLYIANYIFGESGLSSRLSKIIREREGLTYGVYTYLSNSDAVALIEGGYSSTPENFEKAKELLKKEWLKLGKEGVSTQELDEAKKSLLNSFYLRFATIDGISDMLTAMQKYNLGIDFLDKRNDYIRNVSNKDVNAAAKKYFNSIPDFVNIGIDNLGEK